MADVLATPVALDTVPEVRTIGAHDLVGCLRDGLEDFRAIPTQLVFLGLLYPLIGLVAARATTGDLLPLLFPLAAGLTLMGPLLAVGTYEISRRREQGEAVSWLDAFAVLRSPALPGIIALGVVLLAIFTAWLVAARLIYTGTIGGQVPTGVGALLDMVTHTPGGTKLIIIGNLVGLAFAVLVLAISAVSFPMLLDRRCSPALAVQTSLRAVTRNPSTMALWGLVVAAGLMLGSLPFFVGLAVVMPILGHATWHLYRRLVA